MPENNEPSGAARIFGDFAPALVGFTDDVLFGQVWEREELSPRDRSLVTVTEGNGSSSDGLLTQLNLVPAQWARVACSTSGHSLTARDWRAYISSSPPAHLGCAG